MTLAEQLAQFVIKSSYDDLSEEAKEQLKIRVLDALGCAIGAMKGEPIVLIRSHIDDFTRTGNCTMIGGGKTSPDMAAFFNSALVRYLDFNDSYLAKGETCHPSDNLGAILAATEYAGGGGRDFLLSLAVAYQVQCRLSDVAPVRSKGFDHTTQGSYAVAAGVSKALGLDHVRTANAIAICGTAFNALRVTRTGVLSHWKGLAYPNTVFGCTHATFLAMRGITGPLSVFEGNKGFMDSIAGPFEIDWSGENLERVTKTVIKKYNAEVHSQSTLEGVLELKSRFGFNNENISRVEVDIFDVAYSIIGGGEEGNKKVVHRKEEADHSLPYMVACAILDSQVMPEQYTKERINREDVQALLKRIHVRSSEVFSERFPGEIPARITVFLKDGEKLVVEKKDYEGYYTNPMGWETVIKKFDYLSKPYLSNTGREDIINCVKSLETIKISDFISRLEKF